MKTVGRLKSSRECVNRVQLSAIFEFYINLYTVFVYAVSLIVHYLIVG